MDTILTVSIYSNDNHQMMGWYTQSFTFIAVIIYTSPTGLRIMPELYNIFTFGAASEPFFTYGTTSFAFMTQALPSPRIHDTIIKFTIGKKKEKNQGNSHLVRDKFIRCA